MKTIVIYKSRYGSTETYARHIAKELGCEVFDTKKIKVGDLLDYDTIILGGGLYAETIAGVNIITKNFEKLKDKKLIIFTTGLTPLDCREYYDKMVIEKNFKLHMLEKIKIFNFTGKMIIEELSLPHKAAIKALKKLMSNKETPTEMEKLLIDLCDNSGDFTKLEDAADLIRYAKGDFH